VVFVQALEQRTSSRRQTHRVAQSFDYMSAKHICYSKETLMLIIIVNIKMEYSNCNWSICRQRTVSTRYAYYWFAGITALFAPLCSSTYIRYMYIC